MNHVNERKQTVARRDALMTEWHDLMDNKEGFDNESDAKALWEQIEKLSNDIEAFDKKYPNAIKKAVAADEKRAYDSLKKTLAAVDALSVPEAQKAGLRKSISQAAKTYSGGRRKILDDVQSMEDIQEELNDLREKRDTLQAKLANLPAYMQEKYWDAAEKLEEEIQEKEFDLGAMQRHAQRILQESKAAVADTVATVTTLSEVHGDDNSEGKDSNVTTEAKAYYATGFNSYRKFVGPHIPNDTSIEKDLGKIAKDLLEMASHTRQIAKLLSRDKRKHDAVIVLASLFELPGRAMSEAMEKNDSQQKVADWRDVLNKVKDKAKDTGLVSSGDKDADADAKKFAKVMRDLEPKYVELLASLPVGAGAKPLAEYVSAYAKVPVKLREIGTFERKMGSYPGFAQVIITVADSMVRYSKLMKKATS